MYCLSAQLKTVERCKKRAGWNRLIVELPKRNFTIMKYRVSIARRRVKPKQNTKLSID